MDKTLKWFLTLSIASVAIDGALTLKSIIDNRQAETLAAFQPGSSPQFSGEEAANELPDGLQWTLIDKDGYAFDWVAFCESHKNCAEAFRAKGVPFPKIEGLTYRPEDMAKYYDRMADDLEREQDTYCDRDREECPVQCTTDSDCMAKFCGDGGPPAKER